MGNPREGECKNNFPRFEERFAIRRQLLRVHNLKTTGHNLTTTIKHNNKQRNIEISICYVYQY